MDKLYTIYLLTFPNNKKYCGYTSQQPERRWGKNGSGYTRCPLVYRAIQKYGWENIDKKIIFTTYNQDEAFMKEKEIIAQYHLQNSNYGYNLDEGGRPHGNGEFITEEIRKKYSEHAKKLWADPQFREARLKELKSRKPTQQCIEASKIATSKRRKGVPPSNIIPVEQLDKNTEEVINSFISASHAALAIIGDKAGCANILNVCKGKRKTAYGYKWRFKL